MTPVVYAFLPGKSQAVYRRFLSLAAQKMEDIGLRLQPAAALLDFEAAAQGATNTGSFAFCY